ncbi:hypothetical protein [Salinimonas iocasae]|uniref:YfhG lipoprotein n=1 Tax=Salinimonas iocasae TaxID=2572577 RepID=A0A5B7YEI7_9ALTE|nr:hypothetical protein [Salinimonas iocasae]QCZ94074.1 hypothetical protein FBQ74_11590 [Salinimonas iocasae]
MKKLILLPFIAVLTGCAGLQQSEPAPPEKNEPQPIVVIDDSDDFCLVSPEHEEFDHQCDFLHWAGIWLSADKTSWPDRKQAIANLGDSTPDLLKKILLSLPVDTPYQDRLRAQHWLNILKPKLQSNIAPLVETMVIAPNNEMLELESALVVLNKVNAEQAQSSEALKEELEAQRKKLEELLEVEATLMDKNRGNQQ